MPAPADQRKTRGCAEKLRLKKCILKERVRKSAAGSGQKTGNHLSNVTNDHIPTVFKFTHKESSGCMTGNVAQKRRWRGKRTSLKEWGMQFMWNLGRCVLTYYAQTVSGIMRLFR